ncbi:Protein argonaute 7 [Raphanus sativus]|uniref:Protein argonaute 7 n=1 Tax=Raphanus sativus TaxID=3726 RepID=A0A9W3C3Y0_RAPSA|nr:protein argonaute 7-like [Raphanus sativus]XP_056857110.1 protein argonaute 7-like [Raphanus sativus]KAJ4866876.1 Protein argonaute 7 [Raphanus sativus]KAJ4884253.1 Protein argonaute 7 [Raphanus sativus]
MEEKTKNHHSNKHIRNSKSRTPLLHKPPPFHHAHTNPLLFPSSPHHSLNLLSTGIHSSYYYYYCFYSQFHNTLPPLPFHPPPPPLLPLPPPDQRFFNSIPKPLSLSPVVERKQKKQVSEHKAKSLNIKAGGSTEAAALVVAKRPDSGGQDGSVIYLLANHFLVKVDPSQKIYHYNVDISPHPSKEVARMIKQKLVETAGDSFSGTVPAFDGRQNIYSPVEFQEDRLEFFVNLPIQSCNTLKKSGGDLRVKQPQKKIDKLFRVSMRLVSKFDGKKQRKEGESWAPLPQEYIHALDVILRENPTEKCTSIGRSFYSSSMGGSKEIGGGAVGLRGFFQSLRKTQQGLALNIDLSIAAFHESIGVIAYLQKRLEFLKDLSRNKGRELSLEERREVEKALKNIRVFVCHRETVQRYRVFGLTEEITESLWFQDRDGKQLRVMSYFKDHYNYEIQFKSLPCLQISRTRPCYLPMELCMICEGQKFLGKLSDDQTAKIMKMGCQRPNERKETIDKVMAGPVGPSSGNQAREFNLEVSRDMTLLKGRVLQPPKLKLDRPRSLVESRAFKGTRWALMSIGGSSDQKSTVPKFINELTQKCEHLGVFLSKNTTSTTFFEPSNILNNISLLELKLKEIQRAASNNLQLIICVMERKHKGYGDLKRIAETRIGVVTQCCLYPNITKLNSQFVSNLALKINAKIGGTMTELYNSIPSHIPRLFRLDEPVIFMGADVTHPHPFDDCSPSVAAVVGSINWPEANRYVSRMRSQTHRQEIIQDLDVMVKELLEDFQKALKKLPTRIIFFRDGVSETQFKKVLQEELQSIKTACTKFHGYNPTITFAVVQKRHHTRLFRCDPVCHENIPPGTVVDTVITHPKEFDFYLCSHLGVKGTSRPTHYHILWDENEFTSDELQRLVYNLCYTFVRCTKPVSIVPPAYYAHLAAYRGRLYIERSSETNGGSMNPSYVSRVGLPKTIPLPKLSDNVKNLMFYC